MSSRSRISAVLIAGLGLMLQGGCGGQSQPLLPLSNASSSHTLPFDRVSESKGVSPTQSLAAATVPAGTAIVVKLQAPISSAGSHTGEDFKAVLEEPVLLENQVLLAPGAVFMGKVIAAQPSGTEGPGYLRLTLSDVIFDDKPVELRTSSVFAKGSSRPKPAGQGNSEEGALLLPGNVAGSDVKFSTARRLTFRLIDALSLHN